MRRILQAFSVLVCLGLSLGAGPILAQDAAVEETLISDFERRLGRVVRTTNDWVEYYQFPATHHHAPLIGKWRKTWCELTDVEFDIQRSTSIVAPYIAVVTGRSESHMAVPYDTRASAEAAPLARDPGMLGTTRFQMRYTYTRGRWVLNRGEYSLRGAPMSLLWNSPLGTADTSFCLVHAHWVAL